MCLSRFFHIKLIRRYGILASRKFFPCTACIYCRYSQVLYNLINFSAYEHHFSRIIFVKHIVLIIRIRSAYRQICDFFADLRFFRHFNRHVFHKCELNLFIRYILMLFTHKRKFFFTCSDIIICRRIFFT